MKNLLLLWILVISIASFVSCNNRDKNRVVEQPGECTQTTAQSYEKLVLEWNTWLQNNREDYLYLFESVSQEHENLINNLLTLFYKGYEDKRNNVAMIQKMLDDFCPVSKSDDKVVQYNNLEKQVSTLLDIDVELEGYQVRRKSALARLMHNFKIKYYEEKLLNSISDEETKNLFRTEISAWQQYLQSTSDAFEKIVLGKESYSFKYVYGNNYEFDLMNERYKTLVCLYLKDYSVWDNDNKCGRDEVADEYDKMQKKLPKDQSINPEYHYSYNEQKEAILLDEELFQQYLNAHIAIAIKLGISDEGYILRHKTILMDKMLEHYNSIEAIRF